MRLERQARDEWAGVDSPSLAESVSLRARRSGRFDPCFNFKQEALASLSRDGWARWLGCCGRIDPVECPEALRDHLILSI